MLTEIDLQSTTGTTGMSVENVKQCNFPYVHNLNFFQTCMWFVPTALFACLSSCFRNLRLLIVSISKLMCKGEAAREKMWHAYKKHNSITMYFTTPNKSKSNQTPREEKCLQEDAQCRGGEHKRAIVLGKGKKKKRGRRKRGVKREMAFLHLHCTTGGLHAVFTRRLCEFEITRVTETWFHPLVC